MPKRNRSEGWEHAKKSGHKNEQLITELIQTNPAIQKTILACAHLKNVTIKDFAYGGLCETDVDCVFVSSKTKAKTDIRLLLSDNSYLNISVKKSPKGQVFLIGIDRFIQGFELQYQKTIPQDVKRALALYFGSAPNILYLIEQYPSLNSNLENRKHRLVADTLKAYDPNLANALLAWLNANISQLFDYCFARGLAKNHQDWAHIIWYKNMVDKDAANLDTLIYLPDIANSFSTKAEYSSRNGGSTIQLPFGFVQWHSPSKTIPGSMQFHHDHGKIIEATK